MRAVFFYLICFFLLWRVVDHHQLQQNAVFQTLSRLTPDVDYFHDLVDRNSSYDPLKLTACINYHRAVAQFIPFQRSEAYGMMGFCYERMGQEALAMDAYTQAIRYDPRYFWPYYDLGVINYRHGQYTQAKNFFLQAIEQDPVKNMLLLGRSKIYSDVKFSWKEGSYDFFTGLRQGRISTYILLMDCFYKTGAYVQLLKVATEGIKEGLDVDGIFYYYAGLALMDLKDYDKALGFFQTAAQDDPHNADALLYLGVCLHWVGQEGMSRAIIGKATQLHQQGPSVLEPYLKPRVRFF